MWERLSPIVCPYFIYILFFPFFLHACLNIILFTLYLFLFLFLYDWIEVFVFGGKYEMVKQERKLIAPLSLPLPLYLVLSLPLPLQKKKEENSPFIFHCRGKIFEEHYTTTYNLSILFKDKFLVVGSSIINKELIRHLWLHCVN